MFYLGAYAASATLPVDTPEDELRKFWQDIARLPLLRGLELPFHSEGQSAVEGTLAELPRSWDFILTLLPGVMQFLAHNPHFGLASDDESGRQAALAFTERARLWIAANQRFSSNPPFKAVHLHSAPRRAGVSASARSLRASLEELLAKDWFGARLCLEHCDAWNPSHAVVKGFLDLQDELEVARDLDLGLTLNWGRSAIETRSAAGVFDHIAAAVDAGRLWGFMFSGTAVNDQVYGDWQDNHAPIRLSEKEPWNPAGGLLTPEIVAEVFRRLSKNNLEAWGLKVQPFPSTLGRHERIACLNAQLLALQAARQN